MRPFPATRRHVLVSGVGAAVGLPGCIDGDDGDDADRDGDGDDVAEEGDVADPGDAVQEAWPQARYGPANAGARPDDAGPSTLSVAWHAEMESITSLPPVAVDDLVLVAAGSFDGDVYALDATTGAVRWSTLAGVDLNTEPVVHDGTAYLGDSAGKLNVVHTGDPPGGEAPTVFNLRGEFRGAPAVRDGVCYFGAGNGNAYAYDAPSDEFLWDHDTGAPVQTSATLGEETLYLGNDDGTLFALSTADGSERWRLDADERIRAAPAVVDDTVYVGTGGGTVSAVDAADGTDRWTVDVSGAVAGGIPVVDDTAYVADNAATLTALDCETGAETWRVERSFDTLSPMPAVTDDAVYHHFGRSRLVALDPETGEERASVEVDDSLWSTPTVADETVYVGSGAGVYAFSG